MDRSRQVSGRCLKGVWRVSQRCLEGIYGMSEWYVGCLDVSEGQARTGQVETGKVRAGHVLVSKSLFVNNAYLPQLDF